MGPCKGVIQPYLGTMENQMDKNMKHKWKLRLYIYIYMFYELLSIPGLPTDHKGVDIGFPLVVWYRP